MERQLTLSEAHAHFVLPDFFLPHRLPCSRQYDTITSAPRHTPQRDNRNGTRVSSEETRSTHPVRSIVPEPLWCLTVRLRRVLEKDAVALTARDVKPWGTSTQKKTTARAPDSRTEHNQHHTNAPAAGRRDAFRRCAFSGCFLCRFTFLARRIRALHAHPARLIAVDARLSMSLLRRHQNVDRFAPFRQSEEHLGDPLCTHQVGPAEIGGALHGAHTHGTQSATLCAGLPTTALAHPRIVGNLVDCSRGNTPETERLVRSHAPRTLVC